MKRRRFRLISNPVRGTGYTRQFLAAYASEANAEKAVGGWFGKMPHIACDHITLEIRGGKSRRFERPPEAK